MRKAGLRSGTLWRDTKTTQIVKLENLVWSEPPKLEHRVAAPFNRRRRHVARHDDNARMRKGGRITATGEPVLYRLCPLRRASPKSDDYSR